MLIVPIGRDGLEVEIYPAGEAKPTYRGMMSQNGTHFTSGASTITVEGGWLEYATMVLPDDADAVQRAEMRRTWYAAMYWFMTALASSLTPGPEASVQDEHLMERIHNELLAFNMEELKKAT